MKEDQKFSSAGEMEVNQELKEIVVVRSWENLADCESCEAIAEDLENVKVRVKRSFKRFRNNGKERSLFSGKSGTSIAKLDQMLSRVPTKKFVAF